MIRDWVFHIFPFLSVLDRTLSCYVCKLNYSLVLRSYEQLLYSTSECLLTFHRLVFSCFLFPFSCIVPPRNLYNNQLIGTLPPQWSTMTRVKVMWDPRSHWKQHIMLILSVLILILVAGNDDVTSIHSRLDIPYLSTLLRWPFVNSLSVCLLNKMPLV